MNAVMRRGLVLMVGVAVMAGAASVLMGAGRLERDFAAQKKGMSTAEFSYGEACGGPPTVSVYRVGREIRKITWEADTSRGYLLREFYFARGRPALAVETQWLRLDERGEELAKQRLGWVRRVRLHDKGADAALRKELGEHVRDLWREARVRGGVVAARKAGWRTLEA